jgi:hypothetical protein
MLAEGLFNKVHTDMVHAGGIDDQAFSTYSRGGVRYIGAFGYVGTVLTDIGNILARYRRAGGDARFDLSDPRLFPHVGQAGYTKRALLAAGGFPPIVGDSMDLTRGRQKGVPSYPSRVIEGFGQVILEAGQERDDPLQKHAVSIHTGIGRGHAHQDTLNIEIFAQGCRLAPDLGGRHAGRNKASPNMRRNRMHNVVWVDDQEFCNPYAGSTTSGTGWTTSFSPQGGAQYAANSARATSHPQVKLYQRSTAMIEGTNAADMYVFDVFRVVGGATHTYCFHGAYGENVQTNARLAPAASAEAKVVLASRPVASRREGTAPDPLVMTWPLRAKMQKRYQGQRYQADRTVALTMHLFGCGGQGVYVGGATSEVYPVDMPYLHVRRKGAGPLESVYPAIFECHSGKRFIRRARRLKVTPGEGAEGGVALAVDLPDGRTDLLFSSRKPDKAHAVEGGASVTGEFAFLSRDAGGLREAHLVGGTSLSAGGLGVRCEKTAHVAKITRVDFAAGRLTLSRALPAGICDGQVALIGNDRHHEAFQIDGARGAAVRVLRTPRCYQSKVERIDPTKRLVCTELEPGMYGSDTAGFNGTTFTNERHDRFWRGSAKPQERWMYLGWPNTDVSYPREVRWEDLPDADGDGKRELRLMGRGTPDEPKKVLLELEVTRVETSEHLFYFRMPDDPKYQTGGWQYANHKLVNEDGSRTWWATYPGLAWAWELTGPPVSEKAFPDADGDGKRKLYAYHFGPGDELRLTTFVHLLRTGEGSYRLRANAACTISLPAGDASACQVVVDGKTRRSVRKPAGRAVIEVTLAPRDLAGGKVELRLRKRPGP